MLNLDHKYIITILRSWVYNELKTLKLLSIKVLHKENRKVC